MDNPNDRDLEFVRRLIAVETEHAWKRFDRKDFSSLLDRRIRQMQVQPEKKRWLRPAWAAVYMSVFAVSTLLVILVRSQIALKREVQDLQRLLLAVPEMRQAVPVAHLESLDEEARQKIFLTWMLKGAEERLFPRELDEEDMRFILEKAAGSYRVESTPVFYTGIAVDPVRSNLEDRIRSLQEKGKLKKFFQRVSRLPHEKKL